MLPFIAKAMTCNSTQKIKMMCINDNRLKNGHLFTLS
ncbi:hypothetical protein EDC52_11719 [Biostraticola tofi]|uniref:Uncharacterized protein n=1 Tax=Biostraticola tofi TaxID=466109 RepID=A0A4R3YFY7_9GAMM|nr:hypothetical protein EDC52_11719 [Biostraticola tofi]